MIVAELYAQLFEGKIPEEWFDNPSVLIHAADRVGGSGVLAQLTTPELRLSLTDLAFLAIKVSDNTASNLCLRAVGGPDVVNRRMAQEWEMPNTMIHRPIKFHLSEEDSPHTATGTPRSLCSFLEKLSAHQLHSPFVSEKVLELLSTVSDTDMLPRYLPVNYYSRDLDNEMPLFTVLHKPGAVTGVRNDTGIIRRGTDSLAVCIYTKDCPDNVWTCENGGVRAVAEISRLLCNHFFFDDKT